MGSAKKNYFKDPSVAGILKGSAPVYVETNRGVAGRVLSLDEGECIVLNSKILPDSFRDSKRFLMNAQPIEVKSPDSLEDAVENAMTPALAREAAFSEVYHPYNSGYAFAPFAGNEDRRQRVVRLVELCEAMRLVSYGMQTGEDIKIGKIYSGNAASESGSIVSVSVPSRTKKVKDYRFQMRSVATNPDSVNNYAIANGFNTTISIPASDWAFGFGERQMGGAKAIYLFAPEIAAYFKFMIQPGNETSRIMSPFAMPTDLMIEFYRSMLSNVAVRDESVDAKHKLRKLNKAEQEIMLWSLVQEVGHKLALERERYETPLESIDWAVSKPANDKKE
ncbi:MAG: hypothetical protein AABX00_00535 [Nanoarchaeota archaeon]